MPDNDMFEAIITITVEAANRGLMIAFAMLCGAETELDLYHDDA